MRNLIAPAALIASLMLGSAAFAATPAPAAPAKPAAPAHATKTTLHAKHEACEATWRAQKTHVGGQKAFMKACVRKG